MKLNPSNSDFQNDQERGLRLYDYFVDFFAILLPGFFFLSILVLLLGLQVYTIWKSIYTNNIHFPFPLPLEVIQSFRLEFAMMFIIASYLLGFLFFRRGPKEVDLRSVVTCWSEVVNDNPAIPIPTEDNGNKKNNDKNKDNNNDKNKLPKKVRIYLFVADYLGLPLRCCKFLEKLSLNVQWPYQNISMYLEARLPHLKSLVPWGPDYQTAQQSKFKRTKTYMNVLKNQIRFYLPDKYLTIARNEAHVRLSSSLWFAILYLIRWIEISVLISLSIVVYKFLRPKINIVLPILLLSILLLIRLIINSIQKMFISIIMRCIDIVILASLTIIVCNFFLPLTLTTSYIWIYIVIGVLFIVLLGVLKYQIERFFHYQRIRELVFLLDTTFQAFKTEPLFGRELIREGYISADELRRLGVLRENN